ncbi:MAG: cytochrome c maturation protein CcmE [Chitinophagales bacterium]|nr:cytochrome c maturation protein CcmE [Chitinophagales bacterium]MDW8427704.1 cytochrome c maturation protein CcmE [Chitinophagales bacterium]
MAKLNACAQRLYRYDVTLPYAFVCMKKIHIVGLVIIAVAIGFIISVAGDYSSYETFERAMQMPNKDVQIVGYLVTEKEMYYDPIKDPNYFTFYMRDKDSTIRKVILYNSKPRDFERSEQLVVTGRMQGDDFVAKSILMKCPSKYTDHELVLSQQGPTS